MKAILFSLLLFSGTAIAADTVLGRYTLTCYTDIEEARRSAAHNYAPKRNQVRQQLGCRNDESVDIVEKIGVDCKACSPRKIRCRGATIARCKH